MAQTSQFATALIDETINAFNGNVTTVSPQDGIFLINNWVSALHSGDESTNPIANTLSELRMQLQSGNPNGEQIVASLEELTNQTRQAAQSADGAQQSALSALADALQGFGQQLSGNSGSANTGASTPGGNAPGGSTVGASTDPGYTTGGDDDTTRGDMDRSAYDEASGAGDSEDDYQGGGSYGSGYGTGSEGSADASNSGTYEHIAPTTKSSTGAASVGGMGISGGQADSEN